MRRLLAGLFFTTSLIMIGCRSADVDFELQWNPEIRQLIESFDSYYKVHHYWPSRQAWDSLKLAHSNFKRFSKMDYISSRDTVRFQFRLDYEDYYNLFKTIEMNPRLISHDTGHMFGFKNPKLELQGGILLDSRSTLTAQEKRRFRNWERSRRLKYKLLIQNTESGKTKQVGINSVLYIASRKDSLGYKYPYFDKATGITHLYTSKGWTLERINQVDSTLDINPYRDGILRKKIKYTDIKFMYVKDLRGQYKVLGIGR